MTNITFSWIAVCGFLISVSGCNDTELRGIGAPLDDTGVAIAPMNDDEVYVLDIPDPLDDCEPSPEVCDGIDNNCDGQIDEALVESCLCGDIETALNVCVDGTWTGCPEHESATLDLVLPESDAECSWGQDGNIDPGSALIAARIEESFELAIPNDVSVCSLALSAESLDIYYDDEFILGFNDVPLLSSLDWFHQFDTQDGLPRYEWSSIVGTSHNDFGGGPSCIEGAIDCALPRTETTGELKLSLDEGLERALMAEANASNRYEVLVVTTGDNDAGLDCRHSEIVSVHYTR